MKIVSACLLGVKCNFEGNHSLNSALMADFVKGELFPVCPEVLGGLSVPRSPSEIVEGDGLDVIEGKAKVVNSAGVDVTNKFLKGAYETLRIAQAIGAKEAFFAEKSPSCGSNLIFDGTFSNRLIQGNGVTTALLKKNGIKVISKKSTQKKSSPIV